MILIDLFLFDRVYKGLLDFRDSWQILNQVPVKANSALFTACSAMFKH